MLCQRELATLESLVLVGVIYKLQNFTRSMSCDNSCFLKVILYLLLTILFKHPNPLTYANYHPTARVYLLITISLSISASSLILSEVLQPLHSLCCTSSSLPPPLLLIHLL